MHVIIAARVEAPENLKKLKDNGTVSLISNI